MNARQSFLILLVHAVVSVIVIAAATTLTALDKLPPSAATAIFGAAIGLVGGIQATQAVSERRNGRQPPDHPEKE